jgi:cytochrome c oxidase assembly protein subunit 15
MTGGRELEAGSRNLEAANAFQDDWRLALTEPVRRRLRLWFWSIAAMTLTVLVVGGITRLTESGLSMVDWQPLVGVIPPLTEARWSEIFARYQEFPEYLQMHRGMTLEEFKVIFFWEYLHRLVARLIGLVFLIPFVAFWLSGHLNRGLARRALLLFALGATQGVMGWLMVKSGLVDRPSVSHYRLAAHLSLAFLIFGASVWLARDVSITPARTRACAATRALMWHGLAVVGALLAAQIIWGAFVAGLKAGFLLNTFPLMAGRLVPPGLLAMSPAPVNFVQNLVTVQWMHRLVGTALLIAAAAVYLRVRRAGPDRTSGRLNAALVSLIAAQYLLGVLTLVYLVPVPLAVVHQATAMVVVGVWVAWVHHVRHLGTESPDSGRLRVVPGR